MRRLPPHTVRRRWAPFSNRRHHHPRAHLFERELNTPSPLGGFREAGRRPQTKLMSLAVRHSSRRSRVTQHVPEPLPYRGAMAGVCGRMEERG